MIISTDAEKHLTKPSIHLWKQTASNQDIEKNTLNLKRSIYQNKNLQLTSYLLVRDWMLSHKIGIKAMLFSLTTPQFSSVQFSRSVVSDSLQPHESQHTRPPCPSPTPRVHSDSRPSSPWYHPAISSSVVPFSSCPQSSVVVNSYLYEKFPVYLILWFLSSDCYANQNTKQDSCELGTIILKLLWRNKQLRLAWSFMEKESNVQR